MIYLFDTHDNYIKPLDYGANKYKRELKNKEWSFTFEHEIDEDVKRYNKIGLFDKDNNFRLFVIDDVETDYVEGISIATCLNDYITLDNTYVEERTNSNLNCREILSKLLEGCDYKIGTMDVNEIGTLSFYYESRLVYFNQFIELFDCDFDIRIEFDKNVIKNKYIDIKRKLGTDTALRCTYDTNVRELQRNEVQGVYNRIYGWGNALQTENGGFQRKLTFEELIGTKYIEDTASIEKYGLRTISLNVNTDDKQELLEATQRKLTEVANPIYSYSSSVRDIRRIEGFEHYQYGLGDTINIIDEERDLVINSRIISEEYDIDLLDDIVIVLGDSLKYLSDLDEEIDIEDTVKDIVNDAIGNMDTEITDSDFPKTTPLKPSGYAIGGLDTIGVSWNIENKLYYDYEVYASKSKGFSPTFSNRVFKGKASYYMHDCKPKETWYFKIRAVNIGHNLNGAFSDEVEGSTAKVADGTVYFEHGAIGDALIGTLRADRAWFGKIQAQYINLLEIKVGDETNPSFHIDSFARLYANFTSLTINSESVDTSNQVTNKVNAAKTELNKTIKGVNDSVINVKDVLLPSLEDGVLNESERNSIETHLKPLKTSFVQITKEYNTLYSNAHLTGVHKSNLKNAYDDYKLKYDGLINTIDNILILDKITNENVIAFNTAYEHHNKQLEIYTQRVTEALDSITSNKSTAAYDDSTVYTNTQISQVNESIALKVSKDIYDKNNELINKEFTEIKATSNKIEQSVGEIDRNYVRSSQFEQTVGEFVFKFSQMGAENLIRNSMFKAGEDHWAKPSYNHGDSSPMRADIGIFRGNTNDGWTPLGQLVGRVINYGGNNQDNDHWHGFSQFVDVESATPYTFSFYAAQHRIKECVIEIKRSDNGQHIGGGKTIPGTEISSSIEQGASFENDFTLIKHTFRVPSGCTGIQVLIWSGGRTLGTPSYLWFGLPQLEKGHEATARRENSNEIYSNITKIDTRGMTIQHRNGSRSEFTHEAIDFLNSQGRRTLRVKDGGLNFHTYTYDNEMVGFVKSSYSGGSGYNGVTLSTYGNGDYVSMGISDSMDENSWNSVPFISCIAHGNVPSYPQGRGVHFSNAPVFMRTPLNMEGVIDFKSNGSVPHRIANGSSNMFLLGGDNEINIGIRYGEVFKYGIKLVENEGQANKTYIDSYGDWNFQNYNMWNMRVTKTLAAQSNYLRSRRKDINDTYGIMSMTDGELRYTCRQTEHITNKTLIVELPQIMAENIEIDYHVNISKLSWGDYRITEKNPYYFEIETNVDDFSFTFEVVAKTVETPHAFAKIASDNFESMKEEEKEIEKFTVSSNDEIPYWELYRK